MADLMALFNEAFREFLGREHDNIRADRSERNLCGRLMLYLDAARERFGFAGVVCTENLIPVDDVMESPKLAE